MRDTTPDSLPDMLAPGKAAAEIDGEEATGVSGGKDCIGGGEFGV